MAHFMATAATEPKEKASGEPASVALDVILDANALITACKFSIDNEVLVDILLRHCHLRIPQHVAEEATRRKEHPDARRAARRVANGSLLVEEPTAPAPSFLREYRLGQGEVDAIRLYLSHPAEFLVTDELRAYLVCSRMGIPMRILPDLVIELARRGRLTKSQAAVIIEETRSRYSDGIVAHSRALLTEVPENNA
jgi:predicted nucleic acid-binding protein